jgi:hypothetical protein
MPFLKEEEIRRRKKCSEHLKELDRNVGETEVDQTDADQMDANPGTDYKDICWQDGRRIDSIVELKTLAATLSSALNIFSDGVFLLLLKTALFGLKQVLSNFYAIDFL